MVPGLGDYSARAILAFAFDKKFAVLDSNVQRILIRIFKNSLPNNPSEKLLQELAQHLLPDLNSKDFNLALIDFGSQICSWRYVKCDECPVTSICDYYQTILKQENFE